MNVHFTKDHTLQTQKNLHSSHIFQSPSIHIISLFSNSLSAFNISLALLTSLFFFYHIPSNKLTLKKKENKIQEAPKYNVSEYMQPTVIFIFERFSSSDGLLTWLKHVLVTKKNPLASILKFKLY